MYLGGTTAQGQATGIALDSQGNVTILGQTYATDFPTTADAYQPALNGTGSHYDFTLAKLHADGKTLEYSTYFGGTSDDYSRDLAIDSSGINTYFTGHGSSYDFPVTGGSWDTTSISDVHNVYVVRFTMGACFTGTTLRGHVPDRSPSQTRQLTIPIYGNGISGTQPLRLMRPRRTLYTPIPAVVRSTPSSTATNLIMGVPTTTTLIRNNYIIIPPPVANFTSNLSTCTAPLSVQFDDTSTDVLTWNWSFGDGNISSLENPVILIHTSGNYTVNLTANNTNSHGTKIENTSTFRRFRPPQHPPLHLRQSLRSTTARLTMVEVRPGVTQKWIYRTTTRLPRWCPGELSSCPAKCAAGKYTCTQSHCYFTSPFSARISPWLY